MGFARSVSIDRYFYEDPSFCVGGLVCRCGLFLFVCKCIHQIFCRTVLVEWFLRWVFSLLGLFLYAPRSCLVSSTMFDGNGAVCCVRGLCFYLVNDNSLCLFVYLLLVILSFVFVVAPHRARA